MGEFVHQQVQTSIHRSTASVFSVWGQSPACPVTTGQRSRTELNPASLDVSPWRSSSSLRLSFSISATFAQKEKKIRERNYKSLLTHQTFFYYQCKWGRHDRQHQITRQRRPAAAPARRSRDRKSERSADWFDRLLQEATRGFFYPFGLCKIKWWRVEFTKCSTSDRRRQDRRVAWTKPVQHYNWNELLKSHVSFHEGYVMKSNVMNKNKCFK